MLILALLMITLINPDFQIFKILFQTVDINIFDLCGVFLVDMFN